MPLVGMKWVGLVDIYAGRLCGLEDKLLCYFKLTMDLIKGGIRKDVDYADGPAFLNIYRG